jgi:hypothetical protein
MPSGLYDDHLKNKKEMKKGNKFLREIDDNE